MTSASPRLDKRRRTFVRLVGEIHHALNQALSEEKKKRDLNKTEIGKILGLDRSAISKKFDGRHNMTIETLADLAYALDRSVKVTLSERAKAPGSNQPAPRPPPAGHQETVVSAIAQQQSPQTTTTQAEATSAESATSSGAASHRSAANAAYSS